MFSQAFFYFGIFSKILWMLINFSYLFFLTWWPPNINSISCFSFVTYTIFIFSSWILFYFWIFKKFLRMLFSPPSSFFITLWPPSIGYISCFAFVIYTIFILIFSHMIILIMNNDNMQIGPIGHEVQFTILNFLKLFLLF